MDHGVVSPLGLSHKEIHMLRSLTRLAAVAALAAAGSAQAYLPPGAGPYYAGSADLIDPGATVWTGSGLVVTDATYSGCVTQLSNAIAWKTSQGYGVINIHSCGIVHPWISVPGTTVDQVFSRDQIDHVLHGADVLRERYRIEQYENELRKLYPQQQR
jgi:hypothetical protein